jgi:hypothetical protein
LFAEVFVKDVACLKEDDFAFSTSCVGVIVTETEMARSPRRKAAEHDSDLATYSFLRYVSQDFIADFEYQS